MSRVSRQPAPRRARACRSRAVWAYDVLWPVAPDALLRSAALADAPASVRDPLRSLVARRAMALVGFAPVARGPGMLRVILRTPDADVELLARVRVRVELANGLAHAESEPDKDSPVRFWATLAVMGDALRSARALYARTNLFTHLGIPGGRYGVPRASRSAQIRTQIRS